MDLISHPFRLELNGDVATVAEDSDEANAEGIAVLVLTRTGERDLVPAFGVPDPTFNGLTLADVNVGLIDYGPPVEVTDYSTAYPDDRTQRVELVFTATDDALDEE